VSLPCTVGLALALVALWWAWRAHRKIKTVERLRAEGRHRDS